VYPSLQGDVACDVVKLIESFASLARKGGGFQVYNWRVKIQDTSQLKIAYIKPLIYKNMLDLLLSAELKLKSSNIDKESILFSTLLKLQKII
jgi:hypothetical protein